MMKKMKCLFLLPILLLPLIFFSCDNDNDDQTDKPNVVELSVDKPTLSFVQGDGEQTVKIISGNGDYTVKSLNSSVATASLSGENIIVKAQSDQEVGSTTILLTDGKSKNVKIEVLVGKFWELEVSPTSIVIPKNAKAPITIKTGNNDYVATIISGDTYASIDQIENNIFEVTGVDYGSSVIRITDGRGKTADISVEVIAMEITLDKSSVDIQGVKASGKVNILTGNTGYYISSIYPEGIVSATINGTEIALTAQDAGIAEVTVKDSQDKAISFSVTVKSMAAYLYGQYCMVMDTDNNAQSDLGNMQKVTYEIRMLLDQTRGLGAIMGLEGSFLLRQEGEDTNTRFEISGDDLQIFSSQLIYSNRAEPKPAKWYHIAVVFDGTKTNEADKYKMYINGEPEVLTFQKTTDSYNAVNFKKHNSDPGFMIGRNCGQNWRAFWGYLAEARVWRTARSAEEIRNNMNSLSGHNNADLVGWWKFDTGVETEKFVDLSGHNLDAVSYRLEGESNGNLSKAAFPGPSTLINNKSAWGEAGFITLGQ